MISRTTLTRVERVTRVSMEYTRPAVRAGVGERIGELADPRTMTSVAVGDSAVAPRVRPPRQRRARGPA